MRQKYAVFALLAAGLAGAAAPAQAQEVQFQGSTKGCFYTSWETGCTPASSSTLMFLSFLQSTFDVTTVGGLAGIGAAPGSPNVNNLGSFSVTGDMAAYSGAHFLLDVVFSLPTITSPNQFFTAAVKGSVTAYANGLVKLTFDPGTQLFDFASSGGQGVFNLSVNNISMTPGTLPVSLTGDIEVMSYGQEPPTTVTPEPATVGLMATGLIGIAGFVRKRRRA